MDGAYVTHGEMTSAYKILVGNPDWKKPLRKPSRRWENNIRMDFREIDWEGVDWMYLAQDRDQWRAVANTIMKLRVPKKAEIFLNS
jgi:hypothetical protein